MINIFEELKDMGFENLEKIELFPEKEVSNEIENKKGKRVTLEEVLYDKTYVCPVCKTEFKTKAIRSGKNRLVNSDLDLKPEYDIANPIFYECIVCETCGYAALSKNFSTLTTSQIRWIKEKISSVYKTYHYEPIIDAKSAISRYKLALLNSFVKKAKDGEKAYICLKLAWIYRELKDAEQEKLFLSHALTGFENAYNNERFPIFELGELTTAYIIADIYRRFKEYDKAMQWISYVILDKSISLRLKTRALHLKGVIHDEKKIAENHHIE
ncbi:DUF2225 domain-containing protein [Cellulosilyticum lentocellum]|uniref:DUF2225 domain-containing protein n=1 Tax=Cellulosilyticum lentocellum (strain ATCC 49066 / DSM 5427 / NCIMB 11756 / RHM5) TaxID=642492 RepID=F2JRD9_CELLD|nr:DUF2225 domain-containing protein [Cellulosilyticum lentocellum]ADZ82748.1 Protein of unknown function DUF2225 [Cellulosilyticum lentocellum DSM 5427]